MSSAASTPKCGYGISGKSAVPSFETPAVTARCNSPSVHEPIAAGVMFLPYTVPAPPSGNSCPPTPMRSGLTGPENFIQSRSLWQLVQPVTWSLRYLPRASRSGVG